MSGSATPSTRPQAAPVDGVLESPGPAGANEFEDASDALPETPVTPKGNGGSRLALDPTAALTDTTEFKAAVAAAAASARIETEGFKSAVARLTGDVAERDARLQQTTDKVKAAEAAAKELQGMVDTLQAEVTTLKAKLTTAEEASKQQAAEVKRLSE